MTKSINVVDWDLGYHKNGRVSFHLNINRFNLRQYLIYRAYHKFHTMIEKIPGVHKYLDKYEWHGWKFWKREWWYFGSYYTKTGYIRMPICAHFSMMCDDLARRHHVATLDVPGEFMDKAFPVSDCPWWNSDHDGDSWSEMEIRRNGLPPAAIEER